jgi:deazaflavin-dependent oxidoreductase (nitroreductase family)
MKPPQRTMFRLTTRAHVAVYRASKGRLGGKVNGMPILLLTVAGRKTGSPHTSPVSYLRDGDSWVVAGSAGGVDTEPQWFRNLRAADSATVEIGATRTEVSVSIADPQQRDALWQRLTEAAPFFAGYEKKTSRVIPVARLTPR